MSCLIKGNVYQIICLPNPDLRYIGSTFDTLRNRWQKHKSNYTSWLEGKRDKCSIFKYFKEYGIDNFKILLLKSYIVCADNKRDHKHLSVYEQLYINKFKCVNEKSPFTIEWVQKKKIAEYHVEYQAKNKEKIAEYIAEYQAKNKEKIAEYKTEYYSKNKEKFAKKNAEYKAKNKEKISKSAAEKIMCECGSIVTKGVLSRHKKTQKHQNLIKLI